MSRIYRKNHWCPYLMLAPFYSLSHRRSTGSHPLRNRRKWRSQSFECAGYSDNYRWKQQQPGNNGMRWSLKTLSHVQHTQVKCRASLFNLTNRQELKEEEICSMSSQLTPRIVYCWWGNRPRKARVMFSAGQLFGSVSVSPMNGHYFQFRMRRQVDMIVEKGKDLASLRRHGNTKQIFHKKETKTRY